MNKELAKSLLVTYQEGLKYTRSVVKIETIHKKLYGMGIGYNMGNAAERIDSRFFTLNPGWRLDSEICGEQPNNLQYKPDIIQSLKNRIELLKIIINKV